MHDISGLAERYVSVWHETDPARRRAAIEALWAPGGEHYVRAREVRGYDELEDRVKGSHEKNVVGDGSRFRLVGEAQGLRNTGMFHWEMVSADGSEVEATGVEFLILSDDGRIACDYSFITG